MALPAGYMKTFGTAMCSLVLFSSILPGSFVSNRVNMNVGNHLNVDGLIHGRESVHLSSGGDICGDGTIKGPEIIIDAEEFEFTGTIECDGVCIITTTQPFDHTMFKQRGKGTFSFRVDDIALEALEEADAQDAPVSSPTTLTNNDFFHAVETHDATTVEECIELGVEVNRKNVQGITPLILAADRGYKDIVELLVKHGADANKTANADLNFVTPLKSAVVNSHVHVITFLLEHGAEVNAKKGPQGVSALLLAADRNDPAAVRVLLAHDANPDIAAGAGLNWLTPLESAASEGFLEVVEALVENGATITPSTSSTRGPLELAQLGGHKEVATYLQAQTPAKEEKGVELREELEARVKQVLQGVTTKQWIALAGIGTVIILGNYTDLGDKLVDAIWKKL